MRKVSMCAIAATLLLTAGGAQEAQAAVIPVNVMNWNCETVEQWKDRLEGQNVDCDWLKAFLDQIQCGNTPEENEPEQPEVPEENEPEQPGAPDASLPALPEAPEEMPEETPEIQDQAQVYGIRITELVNEHRAAAGLSPVAYSAELSEAAQTRAYEIEKSFSHTRPDGRYFSTALKDFGISYRYAGENIAWGQKSPEEVVTAWMNSEGHRANILSKSFTKLGVGYQQNEKGVNYFTQLFTD